MVWYNRLPILIKHSQNVGRNAVTAFRTTIHQINKDFGWIVAFIFGKDAWEEYVKYKISTIDMITVERLETEYNYDTVDQWRE